MRYERPDSGGTATAELPVGQAVGSLIHEGKKNGSLPLDRVIGALPDDFDGIDAVVSRLTKEGIEIVESGEEEELEPKPMKTPGDKDGEDDEAYSGKNTSGADDPVKVYLAQMGKFPRFTRKEEIECAQRIDEARGVYRREVLSNFYSLELAIKTLYEVG